MNKFWLSIFLSLTIIFPAFSTYYKYRGSGSGGGGGTTSPLSTKGDVWGYSSTNARVPVGSNGQVLTADSAQTLGVKWSAAGVGDALVANPLSQFAATTSAQLAGVLSDETGSGAACFANSPTFTGTVAGISASMVGLGNVTNTSDAAKPVSTAQQTALDLKANLAGPTFTGTVSGITAAMVGAAATSHTHAESEVTNLVSDLAAKAPLVSPSFTTPALGTPSSGVATNLTGTAAGLTAGSVTTVPTLSGDVTNSGNSVTVAQVGAYSAANVAAGATLANAATSSNTASTIVKRDSGGNLAVNAINQRVVSTATAGGTTTMVAGNPPVQIWTGSSAQTIKLVATNLYPQAGFTLRFINQSTGTLTIQDSAAGAITTIGPNVIMDFTSKDSTSPGTWAITHTSFLSSTVPTALLGTGTASSTTFLAGNNTWATPSATVAAPLALDIAAASSATEELQLTHGTQTGTTSSDGFKMGYQANNSDLYLQYLEGGSVFFYQNGNLPITLAGGYAKFGWNSSGYINASAQGLGLNTNTQNSSVANLAIGGVILIPPDYQAADYTLGASNLLFQDVDAGGAARTVTLGSNTTNNQRLVFISKRDTSNNAVNLAVTGSAVFANGGGTSVAMQSQGDSVIAYQPNNNKVAFLSDNRAPMVFTKTANYTVVAEHKEINILCDATSGNVTITGYATAAHTGFKIRVKKTDSTANTCIFDPNASELVDGASTDTISTQYAAKEYVSSGTAWWVF